MQQERKKQNILKSEFYGNYKMIHPNGKVMCNLSKRLADWYVKKNKGYIVNNNLYLNFTPKGLGEPDEHILDKKNICVISGTNKNLTKHHVVPYQYRKHFDLCYKNKNSYDILLLCREEHDKYELIATEFKKQLFNDYVKNDDEYIKFVDTIKHKKMLQLNEIHGKYLNPKIYVFNELSLLGFYSRYNYTKEKLLDFEFKDENILVSKILVKKLGEINLTLLWKHHFLKYGKPKFLPDGWSALMIKKIYRTDYKLNEIYNYDIFNNKSTYNLLNRYDLIDVVCDIKKLN